MTLREIERLRSRFLKFPKGKMGVRGYPPGMIEAIHADYLRLDESCVAVAQRWARSRGGIRNLLYAHGLRTPNPALTERIKARRRTEYGCFAAANRATPQEIDAIIESWAVTPRKGKGVTRIAIPAGLRWEFRTWPLEKRADFIRRLRVRMRSPNDQPQTPFSNNVVPFDYATPAAREIMARLNAGRNSREAICKLNLCSQGVIYDGELWFWTEKTGYEKRGAWMPKKGRPLLHHVIWEKHHGRAVPKKHVVRFIDGNPNNLVPENLTLETRNNLARENQAAGLFRKSREVTALLLKRSQGEEKHDRIETLNTLVERHRASLPARRKTAHARLAAA